MRRIGYAGLLAGVLGANAGACADSVKVDVTERSSDSVTGLIEDDSNGLNPDGPQVLSGACLTETQAAEARPVSMYMMLDSSGSMEELTAGGSSKWQSVARAMRFFLNEARDTDLSMGLQFFPLIKPDSSFVCESHEDCGEDGGPCFLSTCIETPCTTNADCPGEGNSCTGGSCTNGTITLCTRNSDCPGAGNACVNFGLCSNSDPDNPLACILGNDCGNGMGSCDDFERTCTNSTQCDAEFYAAPAVEIGRIADKVTAVDAALRAQLPQGLTPTAPALRGAIAHAQRWAREHPAEAVVTVLATDGLPTPCGEDDTVTPPIQQVIDIAGEALRADPPVRTFVIGVFQAGDQGSITNVNAIARAGGTGAAVFIDATGEVETEFLDALRTIQSGTLACEFQVPNNGTNLDYFRVNLSFDDGTKQQQLPYVSNLDGCTESPNGWHYDVDPALNQPTAVQVCPAICEQFKAATTGNIQLQLGCETILR